MSLSGAALGGGGGDGGRGGCPAFPNPYHLLPILLSFSSATENGEVRK